VIARRELLWPIPRVFLCRIGHRGLCHPAFLVIRGVEGTLSERNDLVRFWRLGGRDICRLTARSRRYDESIVRICDAKLGRWYLNAE
jgi:hypothetical protein